MFSNDSSNFQDSREKARPTESAFYFLIQDRYFETDALLIPFSPLSLFFFPPWIQPILKLPESVPVEQHACPGCMEQPRGVNRVSGRKMDTIVLAWPKTFINNSVPITLGTSLDSCGMGNFIPGLFKTAYIISCTGRDFKMQLVRIFSCRQFCPDVWAEVPSLRFQGKVDGKLEYAWWLSFVYA